MFTPVTLSCCFTFSQSEDGTQADHKPCDPHTSLTWFLKVLCQNGSSKLEPPTCLLHGSAVNLSPLPKPVSVCLASLCIRQTNVNPDTFFFFLSLYWICNNTASVLCFVFWPRSMWDLSSPTRDWTFTPCIGRSQLTNFLGPPGKCLGFRF